MNANVQRIVYHGSNVAVPKPTSISGTTADGVKLSATGFLKLDGPTYHIVADLVAYDKKSAKVYSAAICWEPVFAADENISGWAECCDHSLKSYPFVQNGNGWRPVTSEIISLYGII